jgi:hypothetical protein
MSSSKLCSMGLEQLIVERVPSKSEALNSNLSTEKKKKKA